MADAVAFGLSTTSAVLVQLAQLGEGESQLVVEWGFVDFQVLDPASERGEGLVHRPPRGDHAALLDGAVTRHPSRRHVPLQLQLVDELAETDSDGGLIGQMLGLHLASQAGTNTDRSQNRQRDQRSNQDREQLRADRQVPDHLLSTASRVGAIGGMSPCAEPRWTRRAQSLVWIIGGSVRILPRRAYGLISRPTDHVISANLISRGHAARLSNPLPITVQVGRPGPPPLSPLR